MDAFDLCYYGTCSPYFYDMISQCLLPSLQLSNKMLAMFALFKYLHSLHKETRNTYLYSKEISKLFHTIKVFYCTDVKHTCNCLFVSPKANRNEPYQVNARSVQAFPVYFYIGIFPNTLIAFCLFFANILINFGARCE